MLFIGILLSANRFIRIISNARVANMILHLGMKKALVFSSIVAVLTTLIYGLQPGAIAFLLARIVWGLCYSTLKMSSLNYAAHSPKAPGLTFGVTTSIKYAGGFLILLFGPELIHQLGVNKGFLAIAFISCIGIALALLLPKIPNQRIESPERIKLKDTFRPTSMNLLVFFLAFSLNGMLVVSLTRLFSSSIYQEEQLLIVVSFYLMLKQLFAIVFSMINGLLSLKLPAEKLFNFAIGMCIIGMIAIAFDIVFPGVVIAFLFNTVITTFSPMIAINIQSDNSNSLRAISSINTWWDSGAALGAFSGIYLVTLLGNRELFILLAAVILFLFIKFISTHGSTNRTIV